MYIPLCLRHIFPCILCVKRNIYKWGVSVAQYNIGSLIKRLRKQKGLTQEELAYPIIDRATLSKIESGKAMPNNKTMEMLLEKLGYHPGSLADIFMDTETTDSQKIVNELNSYLVWLVNDEKNPIVNKVDRLIEKLEQSENFMENPLNVQYVIMAKALNAANKKESPLKIQELILDAIKITIPEYNENYIEDYYLSYQDRRILNFIAVLSRDEGNLDKAINIWNRLKINIEKHCVDKIQMGRNYPNTILNLADCLYRAKRYPEAIEACDTGGKVCKETAFLRHFPFIMAVKAMCLYEMGNKEEGAKLLRQVYYTCELLEVKDAVSVIDQYVKSNQINLFTLEGN